MSSYTNLPNEIQRPLILKHHNITDFLKDYYSYRKQTDSKFSYEIWANELGFQSKSSIRLICLNGNFISSFFIEAFSQNERFSELEKNHLKLLANYQNCDDPALKKVFLNRIIECTDLTGNQTPVKDYVDFLSSVDLPLLQLIISFPDFSATVHRIQEITGLDLSQIEANLLRLEKLGLAERHFLQGNQETVWKSNIKHFRIQSTAKQEAMNCFHHETTKEIAAALKLETALKKFRSIYFSLEDQSYTDLSEDIEQFITKLVNKYGNDHLQGKRLFKVNLQAYPLTEKCTNKK